MRKLRSLGQSLGRVLAGVGAALLLQTCGMSVSGIGVLVHVNGVPDGTVQLVVTFKENGTPTQQTTPYIVRQNLDRFAVGVTDPGINTLEAYVQARGADGCILGSGSTTVMLTPGSTSFETSIDLAPDSGCVLEVQVSGAGTVTTPGGTCSGFCSYKLPRGQAAVLSGRPSFTSLSGTWAEACSGNVTTSCTVTVDRSISVQANFSARSCSADGICAFPLPAGARVQSVLAAPLDGPGSGIAAGDTLYSNTAASYPNWAPVQHNLGTNTPRLIGGDGKNFIFVVGSAGASSTQLGASLSSFQTMAIPAALGTIQGLSAVGAVMVSDNGKCSRINPGNAAIATDTSSNTKPLYGAGVIIATNAWAVGAQGTILKFNGTAWSQVSAGLVTQDLYGVWADNDGSDYGFAVGQGGVILQLKSGTWSVMSAGDGKNLRAVWAASSQKAWAVGDGGVVKILDKGSWLDKAIPAGSAPNFTSVSGDNTVAHVVWMTGVGDTIYGQQLAQ